MPSVRIGQTSQTSTGLRRFIWTDPIPIGAEPNGGGAYGPDMTYPPLAVNPHRGYRSATSVLRPESLEHEPQLLVHVLLQGQEAGDVPMLERPGVRHQKQVLHDEPSIDVPEDAGGHAGPERLTDRFGGLQFELLDPLQPLR